MQVPHGPFRDAQKNLGKIRSLSVDEVTFHRFHMNRPNFLSQLVLKLPQFI